MSRIKRQLLFICLLLTTFNVFGQQPSIDDVRADVSRLVRESLIEKNIKIPQLFTVF